MDERQDRAREIAASIARILREGWDPLGIGEIPAAASEYDSYIGGVYRLLATGATAAAVAEHLRRIESESMGLATEPAESLAPIARKLLDLDVRLKDVAS